MNATKKLATLERKLTERRHEARELQARQGAANVALKQATEALTEHFSTEDHDPNPRELHSKLTRARTKAEEPWPQRIAGAQRRADRAEAERNEYIREHLGELLDEIEPQAVTVAETVLERTSELLAAMDAYGEVERRVIALTAPVPGVTGQDIPYPPFDGVRSELRRLVEAGVGAPLPRTLYAADTTLLTSAEE
ncbi:MAG: hypothetical protein M3383_02430 [Actinomycetota bacterium]|nr:hypothetical protein [Actinomycetota bacterium]